MEVCVLRNTNFVFKMRRFYDIRLQKRRDLEMRVKGHSRLFRVVSFDRLCMVFLLVFFSNFVAKMHRFLRYSTSKIP